MASRDALAQTTAFRFVKAERITLAGHPQFTERWVQDHIAGDPSILGLGELELKEKERVQPRAGRLDLLLQDPETYRRYEVELQLGKTDETHIIRTLEYWDIERKRYPQYDHCAVLVAEDITSRFLNVIGLLNGSVPFIAIKMSAFAIGDQVTLTFTTVLDELTRGLVDDDEVASPPADRAYWEARASKPIMSVGDDLLGLARTFAPKLELKYNRHYIGVAQDGQPYNFVVMRARRASLNLDVKIPRDDITDAALEDAGIEQLEYAKRWGAYRLRLQRGDATKHAPLLTDLLKRAYDARSA